MAEWRKVQTRFWRDAEMLEMTPEDKLFYIYIITNPSTTACGCYELSPRLAAGETGYNQDTIEQLIERFVDYNKIRYSYETKEILILNWFKYNPPKSPKIRSLIEKELAEVKHPEFVSEIVHILSSLGYPIDTLSKKTGRDVDVDVDVDKDQDLREGSATPPSPSRNGELNAIADRVIDHLNERTGRAYQHSETSRKRIRARLRDDGYREEDCKLVVDFKVADWAEEDGMRQYLRPKTLFGPENFEGYLQAAREWEARGRIMTRSKTERSLRALNKWVNQQNEEAVDV